MVKVQKYMQKMAKPNLMAIQATSVIGQLMPNSRKARDLTTYLTLMSMSPEVWDAHHIFPSGFRTCCSWIHSVFHFYLLLYVVLPIEYYLSPRIGQWQERQNNLQRWQIPTIRNEVANDGQGNDHGYVAPSYRNLKSHRRPKVQLVVSSAQVCSLEVATCLWRTYASIAANSFLIFFSGHVHSESLKASAVLVLASSTYSLQRTFSSITISLWYSFSSC